MYRPTNVSQNYVSTIPKAVEVGHCSGWVASSATIRSLGYHAGGTENFEGHWALHLCSVYQNYKNPWVQLSYVHLRNLVGENGLEDFPLKPKDFIEFRPTPLFYRWGNWGPKNSMASLRPCSQLVVSQEYGTEYSLDLQACILKSFLLNEVTK